MNNKWQMRKHYNFGVSRLISNLLNLYFTFSFEDSTDTLTKKIISHVKYQNFFTSGYFWDCFSLEINFLTSLECFSSHLGNVVSLEPIDN